MAHIENVSSGPPFPGAPQNQAPDQNKQVSNRRDTEESQETREDENRVERSREPRPGADRVDLTAEPENPASSEDANNANNPDEVNARKISPGGSENPPIEQAEAPVDPEPSNPPDNTEALEKDPVEREVDRNPVSPFQPNPANVIREELGMQELETDPEEPLLDDPSQRIENRDPARTEGNQEAGETAEPSAPDAREVAEERREEERREQPQEPAAVQTQRGQNIDRLI